ncbi:MAG TPA: HNH endonuclease signature motif containing protein [Allocoleopsis sp.]
MTQTPPENNWLKLYTRVGKYPKVWEKGIIQRILLSWAGRKCENCGTTDEQASLHVHHLRWKAKHDCRFENLVVVCVRCHTILHNRQYQPGVDWQERWGPVPEWAIVRGLVTSE